VWTITTPSATVVGAREMKDVGCFNTSDPLEDHGYYIGRSVGNCQLVCIWLQKPIMALSDGTNCWCGNLIPAKSSQVSMSQCNTPCMGINTENCGGPKKMYVRRTMITDNEIDFYVPPVVSSSTTSTPAAHTTDDALGSNQSSGAPASSDKGSGSNKTAIAVGAVVGVLALFAIIGGVLFYLRQKRRREVEEEFRRQANINSFTAGGKLHTSNSSMTDSRLDPEFMNRRQSNGSIADNEDYSRRILKVTNA